LLLRQQEIKSFQDQLKQSEERFQMLFNKAPLGYQSLDANGYLINVNQQWLDILGYSLEEVIGKWFGDFLAPEYRDAFCQRFPVFKAQSQIHSEFEMLHKSGRSLFISFEGKIGYDFDGKFKQTHCIMQDITEQKKNEAALINSEMRYRRLFEAAIDGILIIDVKSCKIMDANPFFIELLGYSKEQLIGKIIWDINLLKDDISNRNIFLGLQQK
jgi:PAS domain S-box-containing protein